MYAARQDLCPAARSQHWGGRVDKLRNLKADGMRKMDVLVVVHGGGKRKGSNFT